MAHVTKMTRAACSHMFKHYERAKDDNGEYLKFGNQEIDTSRTAQNYNLAPAREVNQGDFIRQRCDEVGCLKRKDVNVMCSWIVTAPQSIVGTGHERHFFENTYNFLSERYGKENVVSAYVHMDEVTPHIHFAFVPVVEDKKRGKLKVSAKECVNRKDLQSFHTDLDRHLHSSLGLLYCGDILNGATENGNKTILELKLESLKKEIKELTNQKNELQEQIQSVKGQVIATSDIQYIQPKKSLSGSIKGVTVEQVENLKKTAIEYYSLADKHKKLAAEVTKLKSQSGSAINLQLENGKLKSKVKEQAAVLDGQRSKLDDINETLSQLPEEMTDMFLQKYDAIKCANQRKAPKIDRDMSR